MKALATTAALAAALALTPLFAAAQTNTTTETTETEAAAAAETFSVITSADALEGMETAEVRIEPIDEAPRDQVSAINSSLDPANAEAMKVREQISGMEGVKQALSEEGISEERVVGAATENGELVLYVMPEG